MTLAVVNSREIDGNILTLSASGWTYEFTFVLYDYETESIWYPIINNDGNYQLTCISGHYMDRKLPAFKTEITRWSLWSQKNPDSKYFKGGDEPDIE